MSDEVWIIRSNLTGEIVGAAPSMDAAKAMTEHPRSRLVKGYTLERFVKPSSKPRPVGLRCAASLNDGTLTLPSGRKIDLLKIQATCNYAFQETGEHEFSEAADDLSELTGLVQGPHGDWEQR